MLHNATILSVPLYGCKIWPIRVEETRRLSAFDQRIPRSIARGNIEWVKTNWCVICWVQVLVHWPRFLLYVALDDLDTHCLCLPMTYLFVFFFRVLGKTGRSNLAVRLSWLRGLEKWASVLALFSASHLPGWTPEMRCLFGDAECYGWELTSVVWMLCGLSAEFIPPKSNPKTTKKSANFVWLKHNKQLACYSSLLVFPSVCHHSGIPITCCRFGIVLVFKPVYYVYTYIYIREREILPVYILTAKFYRNFPSIFTVHHMTKFNPLVRSRILVDFLLYSVSEPVYYFLPLVVRSWTGITTVPLPQKLKNIASKSMSTIIKEGPLQRWNGESHSLRPLFVIADSKSRWEQAYARLNQSGWLDWYEKASSKRRIHGVDLKVYNKM